VVHNVDDLLEISVAFLATGADFPALWNAVLKHSRLVVGKPVQVHENGRPTLKIRLVTNQQLVFADKRLSIEDAPSRRSLAKSQSSVRT
jgi:hypothetical protein